MRNIYARPSDAIALAIRFNAAIYVSHEVLTEAGIQTETEEEGVEAEAEPVKSKEPANDPQSKLEALEKKLQKAISDEDYEMAAKIRDEISRMKS
jgi:hypothetical protein